MSNSTSRESSQNVIRKVVPYLWGENADNCIRVVLALMALAISKVFTVLSPFFYGYAVDTLEPSADNPTGWLALGSVSLVLIYGFTRIAGVGFAQLRDFLFARVGQAAIRKLALETFEHIHALSLRYHLTRKTGAMIRIVERGVKGVEFLMRFLLFSVGPLIIELSLVALIFFFRYDWRYFAVVVVTLAVYIWFTFAVTELRVRIRQRMNEADQRANQRALDSLLNYETVKYFAAERSEAERYDNAMENYERAAVSTTNTLAGLNFGQSVIISAGLIAVMILAALDHQKGLLSVGDFVMVNAWMIQITMPLNFLGTVYREIRQSLVDMGDMFNLLDQDPEVQDVANAKPLKVSQGHVEFRHIDFAYDPERKILHDLSIDIPAGQTLAVVGPSGSGKSTLARLIYRFYDPNAGQILIDDQDITQVTQSSLRQNIGIVPQDTVLFNDSIYYNIAYGNPAADHDQVIAAAQAAQIHDFVMRLPNQYETEVGERGLKLSGGEKQRVGIARTLLKNPSILILDEATSALDSETEQGILGALQEMSAGRTVLTIAHRLSTVVHSDEIIVLEQGRIAERGTHNQLIAEDGRYAHMWAKQQADESTQSQTLS